MVKVRDKNDKHKVLVYALSTCAWCKLTKRFLKDNHIAYSYVDVDLCSDEDRKKIMEDVIRRGGRPAYPIVIVDDRSLIIGFHEDKLREALVN